MKMIVINQQTNKKSKKIKKIKAVEKKLKN